MTERGASPDAAPDEHQLGAQTLWHGRFEGGPAEELMAFTESLSFDKRLWPDDVEGSRAHVRGLATAAIITDLERDSVLAALDRVAVEMGSGTFVFLPSDEDIHTAIERRVTELAGAAGGKL
ncbi:MAG: argH, partial [Ilumatobacteraceae bacterium]|nr:argH [Ilumatobacteraceae bacterium]